MTKCDRISPRLRLNDPTLQSRPDRLTVQFDDPPGPSPARFTMPILIPQEGVADKLSEDLKAKIEKVGVGGVYSGAYTGETYAILLFALGGVAGGVLGAIGQDVWNCLKKACTKVFQARGAKRNVLEVALQFGEVDVVMHFEDRNASSLSKVLDEADGILLELHDALRLASSPLAAAQAIELRQIPGESGFLCRLHSYRKGQMMLNDLTKPSEKPEKAVGDSKEGTETKIAEPENSPDKQ